jgi:hypothetical protein
VFIGAKQSYEEKVPAPPSERGDHASAPSSDEPPYTLSGLNNKSSGCIMIVMRCLHQDDLVGHVLPQDDWTVLSPTGKDVDVRFLPIVVARCVRLSADRIPRAAPALR